MRIAICDGNAAERRELVQLLRTVLTTDAISFQIRDYTRAQDVLYDVQDGDLVDIVFMDMALADGWECAVALRECRYDGALILMSDCGKRAVDGYAIEADGYLQKPFDLTQVQEICTRIYARVHRTCLTINSHSRIVRVPYREILYMESRNAKCVIHRVGGEEYAVYAHLNDLEQAADDPRFLRCHQSYLVNMDHIVSADKQFVMINGDAVSIRQRELHRLREVFGDYIRSLKG